MLRIAPYVFGTLVVALTIPFANIPFPSRMLPFTEVLLGASPIADLAACGLLAALACVTPRKSIVVLLAVFSLAAIASFLRFLLVPMTVGGYSLPFRFGPNAISWMLVAYHVIVAGGIVAYALLRRSKSDVEGSPVRTIVAVACVFVAVLGTLFALGWFSERLPNLVHGTDLIAFRSSGIGWLTFGVMIVAFVAVTLVQRDVLDVSISFALMAMTTEVAFLLVTDHRYSIGWFLSQISTFWAAAFLPIGITWQMLDASRRLTVTRLLLTRQEHRSREYAGRLAALWRVSVNSTMTVPDKLRAILTEGGRSMRVDVDFEGYLCRVRGDRFESLAIYTDGAPTPPRLPFSVREPYFLAQLGDGNTRIWGDVQSVPELTQLSGDPDRPWRSLIATMFSVSGVSYVVVFASPKQPAVPLDANDAEFADVLATLISTQLHQKWQLERIVFQAEHDVLTGLRNQSAFRSNIVRAIASGSGAVMIGQINGLAEITRSLGALASDAVLVEVGAALEHALKEGDMVARVGDAQFGILMPSVPGSDVGRRVDAYVKAIDRPFTLGDRTAEATLDIALCFGVALFPSDGNDAEAIITHATAAYDEARGRGRRALVYFEPSIERDYQARRSSLAELRRAITEEQFVAHYQPIVDLATDRVVGVESLVRWKHPTRGIVRPDDFLGLAKETGLIAEIDAIVARVAIADTPALADGNPTFRNYVNLTAERMRNDRTVASLLDLLREFGVPAAMLGVEITESTAMLDVQESRVVLRRFRDEGIRIALDDFGTGFSSLAYLKTFPIDVLKIDRSFIEGLPDDRDDRSLVESIAAIAKNFGFSLHAEGVNNDRQRRWLLDHGCETIQGFAYGEPMPRDAYIAWRDARSTNPALVHP